MQDGVSASNLSHSPGVPAESHACCRLLNISWRFTQSCAVSCRSVQWQGCNHKDQDPCPAGELFSQRYPVTCFPFRFTFDIGECSSTVLALEVDASLGLACWDDTGACIEGAEIMRFPPQLTAHHMQNRSQFLTLSNAILSQFGRPCRTGRLQRCP